MTSCGGKNIKMSKINPSDWHSYLPVQPTPSHAPCFTEALSLQNNAQMRKRSYIDTRDSYRISLVLLAKYDEWDKEISSRRLTPESLEIVRAACGYPYLHNRNQRHAELDTIPELHHIIPQPSSNRLVYHHLQAVTARYIVDGNPESYRLLANEEQPLLPIPTTSRSHASQAQTLPSRQSQFQTRRNLGASYHDPVGTYDYPMHERSRTSLHWTIIRSLFACLGLFICVALLCLLGYSLVLGIAWLVRAYMTLVTTIKADIIIVGRYIAGIWTAITNPFVAIGKGLATAAKSVVHLLQEIVRWARQLRGQQHV